MSLDNYEDINSKLTNAAQTSSKFDIINRNEEIKNQGVFEKQEVVKQEQSEPVEYSLSKRWEDAKALNRIGYAVKQGIDESSFEKEEGFFVSSDMLKKDEVPRKYWNEFLEADSTEQYDLIRTNLNKELEVQERQGNASWYSNLGLGIGASITDPYTILPTIMTLGGSSLVRTTSVVGKVGYNVLVGAGESAVVGAIQSQSLHTYGAKNVIADAVAGGILGAGFTGAGIGVGKVNNAIKNSKYKKFVKLTDEDVKINALQDINLSEDAYYRDKNGDIKVATPEMVQAHYIQQYYNNQLFLDFSDNYYKASAKDMELQLEKNAFTILDKKNIIEENVKKLEDKKFSIKTEGNLKIIEKKLNKEKDKLDTVNARLKEEEDFLKEFHSKSETDKMLFMAEAEGKVFNETNVDIPEQMASDNVEYMIDLITKDNKTTPSNQGKDAGAAFNKNQEREGYESYDELYDYERGFFKNNKLDQEVDDDVLRTVNQANTLKISKNVHDKLNNVGGVSSKLANIAFRGIGTIDSRKDLQIKYYSRGWISEENKSLVKEFNQELSKIGFKEDPINGKTAKQLGLDVAEGKTKGYSREEIKIADRFNRASEIYYNQFNGHKKLSADESIDHINREYRFKFQDIISGSDNDNISYEMAYKNQFKKRVGRVVGTTNERSKSMNLLTDYILNPEDVLNRFPDLDNDFIKVLDRKANQIQELFNNMGQKLIDEGLDTNGAIAISMKSGKPYIPRRWGVDIVSQYDKAFGFENIKALFKGAIESANPKLAEPKISTRKTKSGEVVEVKSTKTYSDVFSHALTKSLIERFKGTKANSIDQQNFLSKAMNDIQEFIVDSKEHWVNDVDDDFVNDILNHLERKTTDRTEKAAIGSAEGRMDIDINFKMDMKRQSDGKPVTVSIRDFLENDMEKLVNNYVGDFAAKTGFSKFGIKSKADLERLILDFENQNAELRNRSNLKDLTKEEKRQVKAALTKTEAAEYADLIRKMYTGSSIIDYNKFGNRVAANLQAYNFIRMLDKMTIAQVSETMDIMHAGGVINFMNTMPVMNKMMRRIFNGKNDPHELLSEIENAGFVIDNFDAQSSGQIGDDITRFDFKYDDDNSIFRDKTKTEQAKETLQNGLYKLQRTAAWMPSGFDTHTRTWAVSAQFNGLYDLYNVVKSGALSGGGVDTKYLNIAAKKFKSRGLNVNTLRDYGLTIEELMEIGEAFEKYGQFKNGMLGGKKITNLNIKKLLVDNPKIHNKLKEFAINAQNEVVAPSSIGTNYKSLVDNMIVKTIFQFRTYGIGAYTNKLRHKTRKGSNGAGYLALSTFGGMMAYVGNVLFSSFKYDNQDEYLEENLKLSNLALGSVSRSTYASILPGVVDTVSETLSDEPVFGSAGRTSGLSQDIFGNPTFDLVDKGISTINKSADLFAGRGDEVENLDRIRKNAISLLPFSSFGGLFGAGLKVMMSSGQEYEKK